MSSPKMYVSWITKDVMTPFQFEFKPEKNIFFDISVFAENPAKLISLKESMKIYDESDGEIEMNVMTPSLIDATKTNLLTAEYNVLELFKATTQRMIDQIDTIKKCENFVVLGAIDSYFALRAGYQFPDLKDKISIHISNFKGSAIAKIHGENPINVPIKSSTSVHGMDDPGTHKIYIFINTKANFNGKFGSVSKDYVKFDNYVVHEFHYEYEDNFITNPQTLFSFLHELKEQIKYTMKYEVQGACYLYCNTHPMIAFAIGQYLKNVGCYFNFFRM